MKSIVEYGENVIRACVQSAIQTDYGVAYGSVVTIKNYRTGGGYLHSHWHLYPEGVGAQQQQITAYSHKDENNFWRVKKFDQETDLENADIEYVQNGAMIRLEHISTHRNLHSHIVPAPLTKRQYQVTGYGNNGTGDDNDIFKLVLDGGSRDSELHTLRSPFRLIHNTVGCALHSHSKQLPKWGWEQMEVTCNPIVRSKNNLWIIEEVVDERLPNASFAVYRPSFIEQFIELHAVMIQGNSGLKPKEGEITSRPWQWPINYRGQPFSGGDFRIYLLGNPVIWWANLMALVMFILIDFYHSVSQKRAKCITGYFTDHCQGAGRWLVGAWFLHYLPFWFMGRVLYFHHYFPAHLFACVLTAITFDYLSERLSHYLHTCFHHIFFIALLAGFTKSFLLFSPLCYGFGIDDAHNSTAQHLKWLSTWDL